MTAKRATAGVDSAGELVLFYLGTVIQLFGEELFSIIAFPAIAAVAHQRFQRSRKTSSIIAWLLTAIWFGAAHLPTYDGILLQ